MSISDARILADLTARVEILEAKIAQMLSRDMHAELYGPEADHTADREARAALGAERRPPGRPARI